MRYLTIPLLLLTTFILGLACSTHGTDTSSTPTPNNHYQLVITTIQNGPAQEPVLYRLDTATGDVQKIKIDRTNLEPR